MTDTLAEPLPRGREGTNLAEVLPKNVQGATSDDVALGVFSYTKLLNSFVNRDSFFTQQDALLDQRLNQVEDARNV